MRQGRDLRRDFDLVGVSRRGEKRRDFGREEEMGWEDCGERKRD